VECSWETAPGIGGFGTGNQLGLRDRGGGWMVGSGCPGPLAGGREREGRGEVCRGVRERGGDRGVPQVNEEGREGRCSASERRGS
jgi:hypothetical protein